MLSKSLCHVQNHTFGLVPTNRYFHDSNKSDFCSKPPESLYLQASYYPYSFTLDINTTVSTWLELMALMSYYFARLWKHISSIFGTIGRREHIQRFLTILRNFGMREPINGILNTSLLEIKGRLYRLLHIINEFSHLRIHSFPLINIPS